MTRDNDRYREKQTGRAAERGRQKPWGGGMNSLLCGESGFRDLHKAACFSLILHGKRIVPTSRPSQFWDPSLTWMVKTQEEGDEKQRAGREKGGR